MPEWANFALCIIGYVLMMMLTFGIVAKILDVRDGNDPDVVPAVIAGIVWPVGIPLLIGIFIAIGIFKVPLAILKWSRNRPQRERKTVSSADNW